MEAQKSFSARLEENSKKLFNLLMQIRDHEIEIKSEQYKTLENELFKESNSLCKEGRQLEKIAGK